MLEMKMTESINRMKSQSMEEVTSNLVTQFLKFWENS